MNNFYECYEYSIGNREQFDASLLKKAIHQCAGVEKTGEKMDKQGVDYVATLKDGSTVTIDAKTRKPGASRWWSGKEPDLCLERYSVVEQKIVGWLFKQSAIHPDYILYTFDKSDTDRFYLIPYMLLRKAAFVRWRMWEQKYGVKKQPNDSHGGYTSDAVFVPASVVIAAIADEMTGIA